MKQDEEVSFREDDVPLDGIVATIGEVLELFGGEIESRKENVVRFTLPSRRGVAVAGRVACRIEWNPAGGETGTVSILGAKEIDAPKFQRAALLIVGAAGAVLALMWPFYPAMAPISGIGTVVAFATYFLTRRRPPGGLAGEMLRRIVREQNDRAKAGA